MLPGLTVVGVLRVPGDANIIVAMESLERVAPALRVTLHSFDIKTPEDLNIAFAAMTRDRVQAVLVVAGAFTFTHRRRIADLALTHRLPSADAFSETVSEGGLMSLGPDLVEMGRQAATLVEKIINGAKPGDLPVEQPARYEASQPQDGQGPRPDDPAVAPPAGGSGDRVTARRGSLVLTDNHVRPA
jgi:putative ABC transport system substrate-binding protein